MPCYDMVESSHRMNVDGSLKAPTQKSWGQAKVASSISLPGPSNPSVASDPQNLTSDDQVNLTSSVPLNPDDLLRQLTEQAIKAGLSGQLLGALGAALQVQTSDRPPLFQEIQGSSIRLSDVGGLPDAKREFSSLVHALTPREEGLLSDQQARKSPNPPHRSYLIHGWSGTGKSHLVQAVAGEVSDLGIPVFEASAAVIAEHSSQEGNSSSLHRLFGAARERALQSESKTAVVIIEDVDVLLPARNGDQDLANQRVSRFQWEMDQLAKDPEATVVVLGTTSRKDVLDASAANRFSKDIPLQNPRDATERLEILEKISEQQGWIPASADLLSDLAQSMPGRSIRELHQVLKEASLKTEPGQPIGKKELVDAKLTHFYGPAKELNNPEWFFRLSVAHELGHAVIRHCLDQMAELDQQPWAKPQAIDQLVFQPRGGSSASVSLKYSGNPSKTFEYYFAEIASNFGGRAAEHLFGEGHVSAGPGNDIEFASNLATEAVTQKGMGRETGPINPNFAQIPSDRVSSDVDRLTKLADKSSMAMVSFYRDFISELTDQTVEIAGHGRVEDLILDGRDFHQRLKDWESDRGPQLSQLQEQIRAWRDEARPNLPQTWEQVSDPRAPIFEG